MGEQVANFFNYSLCHKCKKTPHETSRSLQRCSSCKTAHYCSAEHQKSDWKDHKEICKAIKEARKELRQPHNCSPQFFNDYKKRISKIWEATVRRPLKDDENHMWMFPKVCSVCFSPEVTITCPSCLSISYCSEEHQKNNLDMHKAFCPALKINLALLKLPMKPAPPAKLQLSSKINDSVKTLPEDMRSIMEFFNLYPDDQNNTSDQNLNYVSCSGLLCPSINIIFALESVQFIRSRVVQKPDVVVHVVGADMAEDCTPWDINFEFIAQWVKNLESIVIYFVGPSLKASHDFCKKRKPLTRNILPKIHLIDRVYHKAFEELEKPDIVCAFNSGLHEFNQLENDPWKASVPKLIHYKNVPLLLTAYTGSEIIKDVDCFKDLAYDFAVMPQRNPYADLKPIRNWEEGDVPVFYQSGYISVLYS